MTAKVPQNHLAQNISSGAPKGKHNLFTHFPTDQNCEIRKQKKMTRAARRRKSQSDIPKFSDIITSDHKVVNEEVESAEQSKVCNCGARFGHLLDSTLPVLEEG